MPPITNERLAVAEMHLREFTTFQHASDVTRVTWLMHRLNISRLRAARLVSAVEQRATTADVQAATRSATRRSRRAR